MCLHLIECEEMWLCCCLCMFDSDLNSPICHRRRRRRISCERGGSRQNALSFSSFYSSFPPFPYICLYCFFPANAVCVFVSILAAGDCSISNMYEFRWAYCMFLAPRLVTNHSFVKDIFVHSQYMSKFISANRCRNQRYSSIRIYL